VQCRVGFNVCLLVGRMGANPVVGTVGHVAHFFGLGTVLFSVPSTFCTK